MKPPIPMPTSSARRIHPSTGQSSSGDFHNDYLVGSEGRRTTGSDMRRRRWWCGSPASLSWPWRRRRMTMPSTATRNTSGTVVNDMNDVEGEESIQVALVPKEVLFEARRKDFLARLQVHEGIQYDFLVRWREDSTARARERSSCLRESSG